MIDLTDEQARALETEAEKPPRVRNPRTQETFVLIRQDVFEVVRGIVDVYNRSGWDDPSLDVYEEYDTQP